MSATPSEHRAAARQFASGVTVAAASDGVRTHAITATAFCSLSLDPPMILLAVRTQGQLLELVRRSRTFGVSVLGAHQQRIGEWAATRGRSPRSGPHRYATVAAVTGAPLVGGALAWFDCRLQSLLEHGDHSVLIGLVEAAHAEAGGEPLLYFRGRYHALDEASALAEGPALEALDLEVDDEASGL